MGIIYKATNKINGKSYIGQTSRTLEKRKKGHLKGSQLQNTKSYFHKAIKKYGIDNFVWEILLETFEDLDTKEKYYIRTFGTFGNGYNLTTGGEGGYIRSDESKEKMSNAASQRVGAKNGFYGKGDYIRGIKNHFYGKKHSEETKEKIRHKMTGKKIHSEEWKKELSEKMSGQGNPFYGKKHSEETKEKIRQKMSRRKMKCRGI